MSMQLDMVLGNCGHHQGKSALSFIPDSVEIFVKPVINVTEVECLQPCTGLKVYRLKDTSSINTVPGLALCQID